MRIHSHSPKVASSLHTICDIVLRHGGRFNAGMHIWHDSERLWISCDDDADFAELVLIPDALFIPVTQLEWREQNGELAYTGIASSLSEAQQSLLDAMLELYNATNKLEQVGKRLPTYLLRGDPALLAWLQSARPAFVLPDDNPAYLFIETRLNEKNKWDGGNDGTGYLMPVIDMLNHHPDAEPYHRSESADWWLPVTQSVEGSDECYLRYGKLDRLSMAIWHGYCDAHIQFLASIDCVLQHQTLGDVHIIGTNAARRKINAPRLASAEHVLALQDLVLDRNQLPALTTLIGLAVRSKHREMTQPDAEILAYELIALLIDANSQKYSELLSLCRTDAEIFPLRKLFGQVAEHQLALLEGLRAA